MLPPTDKTADGFGHQPHAQQGVGADQRDLTGLSAPIASSSSTWSWSDGFETTTAFFEKVPFSSSRDGVSAGFSSLRAVLQARREDSFGRGRAGVRIGLEGWKRP